MKKRAVVNIGHATTARTIVWILKDLGYEIAVPGPSFRTILEHFRPLPPRTGSFPAVEFAALTPDTLFVDTWPSAEKRLRGKGWGGKILLFWIVPVGPKFVNEKYNPMKRVGVAALSPRLARAFREKASAPVEHFWPPYPDPLERGPREAFDKRVISVLDNAFGWTKGTLLKNLHEQKKFQFELYGGPKPIWAKKLEHSLLLKRIRRSMAFFHPKPTDTPGFALMEAALQGVPAILHPGFLEATEMTDVFVDGETCLVRPLEFPKVMEALEQLTDPAENARIGRAGQVRMQESINWAKNRERFASLLERIG